jgi:hypothetical protein
MVGNLEIKEKEVKIKRINPNGVVPVHVNDVVFSHTDHEFFVTFSQIEPFGVLEQAEVVNINSIDAVARVKIVFTPSMADSMLQALTTNINNWKKRTEGIK